MAVSAGLDPQTFWSLTPYQTGIVTKAYLADAKIRGIWNTVFQNAKTLPEFGEIIGLKRRPHSFEELIEQFDKDFE